MFGIFKSNPAKKKEKERDRLLSKAMEIQRSGDLKAYARLMSEVEKLEQEIENLNNKEA